MNRQDRDFFDQLQANPGRTAQQQRLMDSMLRWDELEAHHDERERVWHEQPDWPHEVARQRVDVGGWAR
jgi:hypothetical protein